MFKTYFLYHQNAHFILQGVVPTFQVYIIIVFFMTTMVNMLTKSENFKKSKNNKKICNHMPSQLISFYLLISLEGMSTLIRSQGHQIESFLPARASEQGNVIGLVSVYIYIYICHQKKIVIERTRDLIYLKFVATDFSPKITSPSTGENSGDSA